MHEKTMHSFVVIVAERLRRLTRNQLGSARAGSSPADDVLPRVLGPRSPVSPDVIVTQIVSVSQTRNPSAASIPHTSTNGCSARTRNPPSARNPNFPVDPKPPSAHLTRTPNFVPARNRRLLTSPKNRISSSTQIAARLTSPKIRNSPPTQNRRRPDTRVSSSTQNRRLFSGWK